MIDWQTFHFIRPEWLFVIIPLLIIAVLLTTISSKQSGWQGIVSSHLYQHLVVAKDKKSNKPPFYLLGLVWIIACIGMAGPTWEKLPQPVYQVSSGKVLILDMSMSMRATDIQPDRLTVAKFKTIDLLNSLEDGEVGLVVYAGDAFTVSPLTSDVSNITALIPSLRPEIMPIPGSNPLAAMDQAEKLLSAAGYTTGEIYWISDGVDVEDIPDLTSQVARSPYRYSILGVGTQKGAPIKMLDGGFMKDARGNIVLPALYSRYFSQILANSNGRYTPIQTDGSDIENMRFEAIMASQDQVSDDIIGQGDQWQDMGAILVILILPFAAYAFRRGVLSVLLCSLLILPAEPSYAQSDESAPAVNWLTQAFKNADQRGVEAFNKNDFDTASTAFDDLMWKGAALYKDKQYNAALEAFTQVPGAESAYNQGNALARLGQLQNALEKYNEALEQRPGHANATANKKLVESLLEQQEQNSQDGEQENGEDQQQSDSENSESASDESSENQQNGEQKSGEQQEGEQSQQQEGSQENNEQQQEQEGQNGEQGKEEQSTEQGKEEENQGNSAQEQEGEVNAGEEKSNLKAQKALEDMTPEEKEQMQRMQMLMNKVPDDPAYLLQRKMLLESQKRRSERFSQPNKKDW